MFVIHVLILTFIDILQHRYLNYFVPNVPFTYCLAILRYSEEKEFSDHQSFKINCNIKRIWKRDLKKHILPVSRYFIRKFQTEISIFQTLTMNVIELYHIVRSSVFTVL